MVNKDTFVKF